MTSRILDIRSAAAERNKPHIISEILAAEVPRENGCPERNQDNRSPSPLGTQTPSKER
jgi:hypothetical protein